MDKVVFEPLSAELDQRQLQESLSLWLPSQRWFGAKTRTIDSVETIDWLLVSAKTAIIFVRLNYADGGPDIYQLPLRIESAEDIHDATQDEGFRQALVRLIEDAAVVDLNRGGNLTAQHSLEFARVRGTETLSSNLISSEQSNTSIIFGDRMILKLFRRLQPGENPDVEISRFLTEVAHFPNIPSLLGDINLQLFNGEKTSVAMLQEFIANQGDGWSWALNELAQSAGSPSPKFLEAISLLGRRTAELHLALAIDTADQAFRSDPLTAIDLSAEADRIRRQIVLALDALERSLPSLAASIAADARTILANRTSLIAHTDAILRESPSGKLIRIHGDFHLAQVLRTAEDFVLLDFEGEPAAPLVERRKKRCPLKDVAGMLRSFSYAAWTGLRARPSQLQAWQGAVSASFLKAYREAITPRPDLLPQPRLADALLRAYVLEKACYELLYELNNRPDWVSIPISGILALLAYT